MNLNETRNKINEVDQAITKLFEERMNLVKEVIRYKKENGLPILDSNREGEVIARISSFLTDKELAPYLEELYQTMMRVSKDYQHVL